MIIKLRCQAQKSQKLPLRTLCRFLQAWERCDIDKMGDMTQLSWSNVQPDPQEMLKTIFDVKPVAVNILSHRYLNNVAFMALIEIERKIARGVKAKGMVEVRLICEAAPMLPDPDGTWGINPTTMVMV